MTTRTFAAWVEPIADAMRQNRQAIIETAGSLPGEAWQQPSPLDGWSYKDLLAHVAGDTGKNVQNVLESIIAGRPVDPALFADVDAKNARDIDERRNKAIHELVAEVRVDGEALLDLLAQLKEEDAGLRQEELPVTLGEALQTFPNHDRTHLAQLRTALESEA